MSVDEALERYSFYGVEAEEVIATMADQGLLVKRERTASPQGSAGFSHLPPFIAGLGRNAQGEFDPNALKSNLEAAVHGIVNEIEKSVERNMSGGGGERVAEHYRHHAEHALHHAERYREHMERHVERHRDHEDESPEDYAGDFGEYRRRLERAAGKRAAAS